MISVYGFDVIYLYSRYNLKSLHDLLHTNYCTVQTQEVILGAQKQNNLPLPNKPPLITAKLLP